MLVCIECTRIQSKFNLLRSVLITYILYISCFLQDLRETDEAENVVDDTGDNKKRTNENDKEQPVVRVYYNNFNVYFLI